MLEGKKNGFEGFTVVSRAPKRDTLAGKEAEEERLKSSKVNLTWVMSMKKIRQ